MTIFRETGVVFRRQLRISLRNPVWIIIGLLQPVLYLALFGPLLTPLASELGTTNAYTLFVPGLLVQLGLFGTLFAGFGLLGEWRDGVIEAERVTPASRTALLIGRIARDILQLAIQGIILIALGFAFGLQGSFLGMVIGLVLVVLVGAACASLSYALALSTKSENSLASILNGVSVPVLLLSGILLPMTLAPSWLQALSAFIPVTHVVDGVRSLFKGDFLTAQTAWGVFWAVTLFTVCIWVGTRTYHKENA